MLQILAIKFLPTLPFGLRLALSLGLTFYIGVIWKEKGGPNYKKSRYLIAILFLISCILGFKFGRVDVYKMEFSDNIFCYYLLAIINLILWIEISKKFENISILKILGQNTLLILGTHYYILFFLRLSYKLLKLNEATKEFLGTYFLEGIFTILVSYIMILLKEGILSKKRREKNINTLHIKL